jgi:acetyl esterase/lipase
MALRSGRERVRAGQRERGAGGAAEEASVQPPRYVSPVPAKEHLRGGGETGSIRPAPMKHPACLLFFLAACAAGSALAAEGKAKAKAAAPAATPPAYAAAVPKPTYSEIRYGPHERHVLDFWRAEAAAPTPLVFVIHGGGWGSGEKERVDRFVDVAALLRAGISVASINYRLIRHAEAEGVTPPVKAPLHDAARALQFVRSQAAAWNLDKVRIGAAGGSAGACSSLWLAFHDDLADPRSRDPVARESTRLFCAAVNGAQTTLDPQQMKEWTPNSSYGGHAFGVGAFPQFLAARDKILPWIAEYSPYALVSAGDPPVYLFYNAPPALGQDQKDPTHTSNFGVKLQERCASQGVRCELVYPGAPGVKHAHATAYLIATLKGP